MAFFGSTIGNLSEGDSADFLKKVKSIMNPGDRLLIGMDMVKPLMVMEAAYNDSEGVTRRFNLNMLANLNRELKADFDLNDFQHLAFYNSERERIEMHLRAKRAVSRANFRSIDGGHLSKRRDHSHRDLSKIQ